MIPREGRAVRAASLEPAAPRAKRVRTAAHALATRARKAESPKTAPPKTPKDPEVREPADDTVEVRHQRVLEAVASLAGEGGFGAVRMRDIAKRAGLALGTLYRDFAGKDDVLVALLEREVGLLERSMEWLSLGLPTYLGRVMAFFGPVTLAACSREKVTRALLQAVASGNVTSTEKIERYHGRAAGMIMRALGDDHPSGEDVHLSAHVRQRLAYLLSQIWFAQLVGWMGRIYTPERAIGHVEETARWLIGGALAEARHPKAGDTPHHSNAADAGPAKRKTRAG